MYLVCTRQWMRVYSQGVNSLGQDPHQEDVKCRVMPNMLKARAEFVHNYILPSANGVQTQFFHGSGPATIRLFIHL